MARKISRKSLKQDEFVEAAFDAGEWLEENWKTVALAVACVVAAILLGYAWVAWSASRVQAAGEIFDRGYELYQDAGDDATPAARWDEAVRQFEEAAAKAGRAPLSDVAVLYQGLARMQTGSAAEATPSFEQVAGAASNPVMRATARANLAEALAASGDAERAAEVWRELAAADPAYYPADHALLNLGKLLLAEGKPSEARDVLQDVVDEYPQTTSAAAAQALLGQSGSGQ